MEFFNLGFKTLTLMGKPPQKLPFFGRKRFFVRDDAGKSFIKLKSMKFNNLSSKLFNFLFN